jgi:hypothetical protein
MPREPEHEHEQPSGPKRTPRPFLGMHFRCCGVYSRIFLNAAGTAFAGNCPRCARPIRIRVGEEGSTSRFWTVE